MKPVLPVTKIMPAIISDEELGILLALKYVVRKVDG